MLKPEISQTVPRHLTHRATIAEVFVTSAVRIDADTVDVGAQVPRFHAFHSDVAQPPQARYDPLLFGEACRQASILVAHQFYGAPADHRFLLRSYTVKVLSAEGLAVLPTPSDAVIRWRLTRRVERKGTLTGLEGTLTVRIGDVDTVACEAKFSWIPPRTWDSIRARQRSDLSLPAAVTPLEPGPRMATHHVGRLNPYNVVVGPLRTCPSETFRGDVVVDLSHPTMFDHPLDHIPGMLQMEAFRQTVLAGASAGRGLPAERGLLRDLEINCISFGELDLTTESACELGTVVHEVGAGRRLDASCSLWQQDRKLADATLRFDYPATPAGHGGAAIGLAVRPPTALTA